MIRIPLVCVALLLQMYAFARLGADWYTFAQGQLVGAVFMGAWVLAAKAEDDWYSRR